MSGLISVEDEMPDFDVEIVMLVPTSESVVFVGVVKEVEHSDCGWFGTCPVLCNRDGGYAGYDFDEMTHWAPIPHGIKNGE